MTVIKCIQLLDTFYVAVGLYGGFKLFSIDGSRLLFNIPCKVKVLEKPYAFTVVTGYKINPLNNQFDSLICGDNYGQVFLVTGSGTNWKGRIIYTNMEGLTPTAMASGINFTSISIGYETGEVIALKLSNDGLTADVIDKIPSPANLPCLAMGVMDSGITNGDGCYLINCFLNGEVRIYKNLKTSSTDKLVLLSILGAHLRLITSLAIHKNYFITAGDDCFVNIWKLDQEENISLESSHELKDKMPVGVAFNIKTDSTDVIACCYDNTYLAVIKGQTFN
jgi:WD40 repeat protein